MALFKILKGESSQLPLQANEGWIYFVTDLKKFAIDLVTDSLTNGNPDDPSNASKRVWLNADQAEEAINAQTADSLTGFNPSEYYKKNSDIALVTDGGTGANTAAQARSNLGITPANIGAATTDQVYTIIRTWS